MESKKAKDRIAAITALALAALYFWKKKPPPGKATLWGIVTDASTGKPISGIESALDSFGVTTDIDGRYEVLEVEPGAYNLVFTDPLASYEPLTY